MISYQLYSSRDFPPLAGTLAMLAKTGFTCVEGFGGLFQTPQQLTELVAGLKANGLVMKTSHFGLDMLENQPDYAVEVAKTLGMDKAYCPHVMPDQRPTDAAGWRAFGARLQKAGAPLRAAGVGFGWHNHDFEFQPQADGSVPMAALLEGGPDLEWEIDLAWVQRGGSDPIAWIEAYKGRISAAHVKDIAPAGTADDEGGWADAGHGTLPLQKYVALLKASGVKYFVLEHDNPKDHERFARRSLATINSY